MAKFVPAHRRFRVVGPIIDWIELSRSSLRKYRPDEVQYFFQGNVLEVSTSIGCKVNCIYCPQELIVNRYLGTSNKPPINMSTTTFVDCLRTVPKEVDITFSGFSEPFLNPDTAEMMLLAHNRGHKLRVYTTLVGLDQRSYEKIRSIPFEEFVIHLPDMEQTSNIPITNDYLNMLETIANGPPIGTRFCILGRSLDPRIDKILTAKGFDVVIILITDRGGNLTKDDLVVAKPQKRYGRIECLRRVRCNILLPDGRVYSCSNDFGLKYQLGNLLESDYRDLFTSPNFCMVERSHSDPNIQSNCRQCIFSVRIK
jgi:radical SAM protein with 4Fe4S-binding SPASM domain